MPANPTVALGELGRRICPECATPYIPAHRGQVTCGADKCRQRKSRRERGKSQLPPAELEAAAERAQRATGVAEDATEEIARDLIRQELTPIVREALSESVLGAIADMVALTPLMVAALKDDLTAQEPLYMDDGRPMLDADGNQRVRTDFDRREKATKLVARYTVGSPSLAPQPESADAAPIQVIFQGMPRPNWDADGNAEPAPSDALLPDDPRTHCDICTRTTAQLLAAGATYVEESTRCTDCHAEIRSKGLALLKRAAEE